MQRFSGTLYRALNPLYAREPLSGEGAKRHGGRFNARGVPALYNSLSPHTAIREASQVGTLQPLTLVALKVDIARVFDARSEVLLADRGMSAAALAADDWREQMRADGVSHTQRFASTLVKDGFSALLVRSFARGTGDEDCNLVVYEWGAESRNRITPVDDEQRLI